MKVPLVGGGGLRPRWKDNIKSGITDVGREDVVWNLQSLSTGWTTGVLVSVGILIFPFVTPFRSTLGPIQPLVQWVLGPIRPPVWWVLGSIQPPVQWVLELSPRG
jgi:hypothetical protein